MTTIETYKGFQIKQKHHTTFLIYYRGKQVFTARWQECDSVEDARKQIDQSLAQKEAQIQQSLAARKPFVIGGHCELENGSDRCHEDRWLEREHEKQLETLSIIYRHD